jgi:hypothetical protein
VLGQNIGRVGLPDMASGGRPSLSFNFAAMPTLDERITFSRGTGATRFNEAGNLVGVDFSVTSVTIGTGSKTFTLDATAGVNRSWAAGDSVLISQQSNSANNMTGTVTSYTASTQVLVVDVTSTGGSGTITSWRVSSLMPRFDYNPSTLAAQGLLIEESRTNLLTYSEDFSNAVWPPTLVTVTSNTTVAPSNTTTADTITDSLDAAPTTHLLQISVSITNGVSYTISCFVKQGTLVGFAFLFPATGFTSNIGARFRLDTGVVASTDAGVTATITNAGNGWYRCTATATATSTVSAAFQLRTANATTTFYQGTGTGTIILWGAQLEAGAFPTSYIPTTVAQVTRNADLASVNTLSPWYNSVEGTLFAEVVSTGYVLNTSFPIAASIDDGSNNNRITAFQGGSAVSATVNVRSASVSTTIGDSGVDFSASVVKLAGAFSGTSVSVTVNGGSVVAGTTNGMPSGLTTMRLGGTNSLYLNTLNGYLRRVTYYPRRLSNAELQAITT